MTQSQVLDLLDMMREMVALQKKILERFDQPAPTAAVRRWQEWEAEALQASQTKHLP